MTQIPILIVDDDAVTRTIVAKALTDAGHETVEAVDGEDGERALRERSFPIALVDIEMPKLDGLELLRRMRQVSPVTRTVIMSGYVDLHRATKAKRLGAISFVPKPLTLPDIEEAVRRFDTEERYWRHVLLGSDGCAALMTLRSAQTSSGRIVDSS